MSVEIGRVDLEEAIEIFGEKLALGAASSALTTIVRKAQNAQAEAVEEIYGIPKKAFKGTLILQRSTPKTLEARIISVETPVNIVNYRARQTKKGISAEIKIGKRKVIPHGFIYRFGVGRKRAGAIRVKGSSLHDAAINRSRYYGRTIKRGKRRGQLIKREKLRQVYGPTPSHLADNPEVAEKTSQYVGENFPAEFERAIERMAKK